ncbi:MAG: hypothetical protein FWD14_06910 [Treponema sp.]|nr:hypothetical protein [Treponema sp.]
MDNFDNIEDTYLWNNFKKIFNWRKPLLYVSIFAALIFYYLIFIFNFREENYGLMEISKSIRFFTFTFFVFWIGIPFIVYKPLRKIKTRFLRFLILFGYLFLVSLIVSFLAWEYFIYDNKQLNSYKKVLPIKNSPYYRNRNTLIYNDIKEVRIFGSGENTSHGFIMNNDQRYRLGLKNFTARSKNIFLFVLYNECEWLRESITATYGSIDKIENRIIYNSIYRFNIQHFLFFLFIIWILIAFSVILLIYIYDPNIRI